MNKPEDTENRPDLGAMAGRGKEKDFKMHWNKLKM